MNIPKISNGAFVNIKRDLVDWANEEVLAQIKGKFAMKNLPTLWDGLPNAEFLINQKNMPCRVPEMMSAEQINNMVIENNIMLKQIISQIESEQ